MIVSKSNLVVDICRQLISIPSLSGEENLMIEKLQSLYEQIGFDEIFIDEYGSITATIKGNNPGKNILFDAHVDTVPISDVIKWQHDPYGAELMDGKIFGRGTTDMKGALAAMISAISEFKAKYGKNFNGEIHIAAVVHEECFEGVASRLVSKRVSPDLVVIGEPSELNIKCGQRGRCEIVVETFGKPAHSANPEKGINAVYQMMHLIEKIATIPTHEQEFLGKGILELTDIKSQPYPGASVVPDYCKATYDRRLLIGETKSSVLEPIQKIITELEKQDSNFKASVSIAKGEEKCYTGNTIQDERFFPAWLFDQEADFITQIQKGLMEVGLTPKIAQYPFCTNGSHYAGEAGIRTIGFGPSKESLAHVIDEYIEVEQLEQASKGYLKIMELFTT